MSNRRATGEVQEGYARLPEDLLHDLLDGSTRLVQEVEYLLGTNLDRRDDLRTALEALGILRNLTSESPASVCGVDGGFAVERTASVDLSLSVAVGVEGFSDETTFWGGTQYEWWTRASKHDLEAERLCRGVMVAQELAILSNAPHAFRILDGSHLTPVIQLNSALTVRSDELAEEAVRVWTRLQTVDALRHMAEDVNILAMPKYDSSRVIAERLEREIEEEVPGDDKLLMSLLLSPGEYIEPQRVEEDPWSKLHLDSRSTSTAALAAALELAIRPLRERRLTFTYFKPDELSPAFRIEAKLDLAMQTLENFLATLKHQMTGPFVREPYPQYLADVMAKSVGLGLNALHSSVLLALSKTGRVELAELLLHSYRTEGV